MSSKAVQRGIDGIVRDLLEPFLSGRFAAPGWTLIGWDAEQGICMTFEGPEAGILLEFEERNDALDCYARTARFNVCTRRQPRGDDMTDADRQFVDAVIAVIRERETRLPRLARPAATRKEGVREIFVDRLLMHEGGNAYYINPYVGCMIACPFCYVIDRADFSRAVEGAASLPWGQYLDVKVNAAEVLRREVRTVRSGIVRMSPILTDPYQPAERRYRITRQILEVLVETDLAPVILTRAPRILDDLDLLKRFRRVLVGFSIPTDDDAYRQIFEPNADPIEERLDALRALHAAGIGTFAVIQPVLPMNIDRMVEQVAPYVRAVRLDRLYFADRVRAVYEQHGLGVFATEQYGIETIDRLSRAFHDRGVVVESLDDFERLLGAGRD